MLVLLVAAAAIVSPARRTALYSQPLFSASRVPLLVASLLPTDEATQTADKKAQLLDEALADALTDAEAASASGGGYLALVQEYPFATNVAIATAKTAAADLVAQLLIARTPLDQVDLERTFLFMLFGAVYLGGFQYIYQVNIFKKIFPDIERFTSQPWADKLTDVPGLKVLASQTALDLIVLTAVYLPAFYVFKAGVFGDSADLSVRLSSGLQSYATNFAKDELDLLRVWLPADILCFSVPLYLRLPVRHVVSFAWTVYLSVVRGGH